MTDKPIQQTGPILFEDPAPSDADAPAITPQTAPPVPDPDAPQAATALAVGAVATPVNPMQRWFWAVGSLVLSSAAVFGLISMAENLFARSVILGSVFSVVLAVFALICLMLVLRELAALSRLRKVGRIQETAARVLAQDDLAAAKKLSANLQGFYRSRADLRWHETRLKDQVKDTYDADAVLAVTERVLLEPLDARALQVVETAARRVATTTALVPLAFVDVLAALWLNLAMIRQIAEIYGGRGGSLGTLKLARSVVRHIVVVGALSVGDDLIGALAGSSVASKVSRRFGEGVINGTLTARLGVTAIEQCRPLAFNAVPKPSSLGVAQRALTGLFSGQTNKA